MRTSRKRRGGYPPHSGRIKPPQKLLRPLPDSARVGFSHRHSYRAKSLEGPLRRVFFFQVIVIPSVVTAGEAQNRICLTRVCPNIFNTASTMQLAGYCE